jgi:HemY protein
MKSLIYLLVTLTVVTVFTLYAMEDRGYVLINVWGYTIESSLVTWLVLLTIGFFALHYVLRLTAQAFQVPAEMKKWRSQRRQYHASQSLLLGLENLAEGNWRKAEREVLKHINDSQVPMLNYLTAARAAHELNDYDKRDSYLKLAGQNVKSSDVGVKLTQAELQMRQNQHEQALATLRTLQQQDPQHRTVLKTLAKVYRELQDWNDLISLVPLLRKLKVYKAEELDDLEREAYIKLVTSGDREHPVNLSDAWYRMPQSVQNNIKVLTLYIQELIRQGQSDIAEPLIRNALKREWNNDLVRLYGIIDGADANGQLSHAESWLAREENNPYLLLTLGRLSLRCKLWGKARSYLEASISVRGLPEAHNELAHLLERLGENDLALQHYRLGLSVAPNCDFVVATNENLKGVESVAEGTGKLPGNKSLASS